MNPGPSTSTGSTTFVYTNSSRGRHGQEDEDKISRCVRTISRAENRDAVRAAYKSISSNIKIFENRKYVRKYYGMLLCTLADAFKSMSAPQVAEWRDEGVEMLAEVIHMINQVVNERSEKLGLDPEVGIVWLMEQILRQSNIHSSRSEVIFKILFDVLSHIIELQVPYINPRIPRNCMATLEKINCLPAFKLLCSAYAQSIVRLGGVWNHYTFETFPDFIDLVVGYMVDEESSKEYGPFCYDFILSMSKLFKPQPELTKCLLKQILDDAEEEIKSIPEEYEGEKEEENKKLAFTIGRRVILLTRAYVIMLHLDRGGDRPFICSKMESLMSIGTRIFKIFPVPNKKFKEMLTNICLVINEAYSMSPGTDGEYTNAFIRSELEYVKNKPISYGRFMNVWEAFCLWIEHSLSATKLPTEIVELAEQMMEFLDSDHVLSSKGKFQREKVILIHCLLRTRNVVLLQKVYEWQLAKHKQGNKASTMNLLAVVSDLASNKSGSILTMWALQPSLFDLLLNLATKEKDKGIKRLILKTLKLHAFTQSHWLGSLAVEANQSEFSSPSPCASYLPTLTNYWLSELYNSECIDDVKWMLEWIMTFLHVSNQGGHQLYNTAPNFFLRLLNFACLGPDYKERKKYSALNTGPWPLHTYSQGIMEILTNKYCYSQIPELQNAITRFALQGINRENTPQEVVTLFVNGIRYSSSLLLSQAKQPLIRRPIGIPHILLWCDKKEYEFKKGLIFKEEEDRESFYAHPTLTQFLIFIHHLCSPPEECKGTFNPSANQLRGLVDNLARSKLKTQAGKPSDFFALFHEALKGGRMDDWKLEFVFLLEQTLHFWVGELGTSGASNAATLAADSPENSLQQFYRTNWVKCLDWLKRIRLDMFENAMTVGNYELAFYQATISENKSLAELALFHLQDMEGVKACGSKAGWYYLNGNFELALKALENEKPNDLNKVDALIAPRIKQILEYDFVIWEKQENKFQPLEFFLPQKENMDLLDHQFECCDVFSSSESRRLKTFIEYGGEAEENLDINNQLKACHLLQYLPEIPPRQKEVECFKLLERMIEAGNLEWAARFFIKATGGPIDGHPGEVSKEIAFPSVAKYHLNKSPPQPEFGAKIMATHIQSTFLEEIYMAPTPEARVELERNYGDSIFQLFTKLKPFPNAQALLAEKWQGNNGDINCPPLELAHSFGEMRMKPHLSVKGWLNFGDYYYGLYEVSRTSDSNAFMSLTTLSHSQKALLGYTRYLQRMKKSASATSNHHLFRSMIRVIVLMERNPSLKFPKDSVFARAEWLDLLPRLSQSPRFREAILKRFPQQAALYLWSKDSETNQTVSTGCLARKLLFDPLAFQTTEMNEEPYIHAKSTQDNCSLCAQESQEANNDHKEKIAKGRQFYCSKSKLNVSKQIQSLGIELLRVGTSSEETWTWNLERLLYDWNKRISSMKKDLLRDPNPKSVTPKIVAYIKPVITFLTDLWKVTIENASSPAQNVFVVKNRDVMNSVLKNLESASSVEVLGREFERLLLHLEKFEMSTSYKFPLVHLSPTLANLKNWGQGLTVQGLPQGVTVLSVSQTVYALPTKTKPKKIGFLCSNGRSYQFLVKGNENLNVDAGVMQFFKISKSFINKDIWPYAVTPLGNRGGLIQMVDNGIPVFQLYKRFLNDTFVMGKPTDIYWRKMKDAGVKGKGIGSTDSAILKQVFHSMQASAPPDLISKELFLNSVNPQSWFKSVQNFTRDSSISCVIGYLLGIGDRHLDNILIDVDRGHLIHVDFSLIFDRGAKLRVPERVPFRLTQCFRKALQYPGTEGAFTVHFENALTAFQDQDNFEMASFCAKTISFAHMTDEDYSIDPNNFRKAELRSALSLLELRYPYVLQLIKNQKKVIFSTMDLLGNMSAMRLDLEKKVAKSKTNVEHLTLFLSQVKQSQSSEEVLVEFRSKMRVYEDLAAAADLPQNVKLIPMESVIIDSFEDFWRAQNLSGIGMREDKPWVQELERVVQLRLSNEAQVRYDSSEKQALLEAKCAECKILLKKATEKWRRILANYDTLIQFISGEVSDTGRYGFFRTLAVEKWINEAGHFWLHSPVEKILELSKEELVNQTDLVELIWEELFHSIQRGVSPDENQAEEEVETDIVGEKTKSWSDVVGKKEESSSSSSSSALIQVKEYEVESDDVKEIDPGQEYIANYQIEELVKKFEDKVSSINVSVSASSLIGDATSDEHLSKMFEGWMAWV